GTPAGSALAPPEEADLCRLLGGLLERAGETAAALERYRRAFALDPANPRNRLSLAIAYCAAGTPEEAAALLKPWAREPQPPGATQQPDAADVADRPNGSPGVHALGLYTLALALEETGFPEDALALYRRACTIARQAGQADRAGVAGRADAAVARLEDYFDALQSRAQHRAKENEERRKKNLDPLPDEREACARACALCDHGLKLKTGALEDPGFLEALGRARNGSDEDAKALAQHPHFEAFQGAMEAFQKAVVTAPKLARAYYELGVCSVMLGRPGTARKLLDEAAACSPNNLAVLNLQGEVLLELGQWEDAARVFNKLLMLEPDSGRANFGLARAYAGLQASGEQCRMALDALLNAVRLGVRDRRMVSSQVLVLDDGRELEGYVTEEPQAYLLRRGESAERIEKAKVKEVRQRPGMHERLAALVQRFNSGEKPAPVPVIRSSPGQPRSRPPDALNPWSGTLIEK
ncbi:MAG: tetratricopeptide repeat protein, partial [Planctomycetota bacterium]|nr:tetratricopeptide repeat protein [Planctomycetota bacterium]